MIELLLTGFLVGALHIVSAPDHLAAIFPLGLMGKKRSWQIGLLWGLGHLLGLLGLGILIYFFKSFINLEQFSHYEFLYIGFLLIIIGLWVIYQSKKMNFSETPQTQKQLSKVSVGTGFIHGFAGFSHIYTLAPTLSMNNNNFFSYFGGFAFGSIFSVVLLTWLLCFLPENVLSQKNLYQKICKWSGIIALAIGIILLGMHWIGIEGHHHH